jgi:hypothetical protein
LWRKRLRFNIHIPELKHKVTATTNLTNEQLLTLWK